MRTKTVFSATAIALATLAPSFATRAYAQGSADTSVDAAAEAKRQFLLGKQAFEAKRYADAAQNFEAAGAYKPHPVTFYTAAVAWELAGRPDRAADAFARAVEPSPQGALKDDEGKKARERLSALEGTLGTVTVTAPDGWKVQLDGNTEVGAPARLHGRPGLRTLVYRAPGKAVEKKELTLEGGQKVAVSLPEPPPQIVKEPEPEKTTPKPSTTAPPAAAEDTVVAVRKSAGLVLAGVGAAGLVSSLIIWGQAQGAKDVYDQAPTQQGLDHGQSLEKWTNITLIGGGILLAGGIALYFVPIGGKAQAKVGGASPGFSVAATPNGGLLKGQF